MLVVFSGLPSTGKTTLSQALIKKKGFTYIRIDEIEFAIQQYNNSSEKIGAVGYEISFSIALSNLKLGNTVVADNVNPVIESRLKWKEIAQKAKVKIIEIEVVCSDKAEHKRRIETRSSDIENFKLPDWQSVQIHDYQLRTDKRLIIDTAKLTPENALAEIEKYISSTI
ncbi:AAA family ATPase [Acinetobacter bereziniae]|uniref:AAA family ATPase n=1 Tax=Acinetobacter bereziniae TaxID=106648 RepID=UPI00124FC4DE|nr:AAA family ATPase [Acinetobacter bereziniae]MBJ9902975.1 AAA family ATPase [Acinetobacter bereziniae]MCU4317528.1 ATP-binding protein [Acinetobacter bereziniae]MCU4598413.1 ATP-binding protein [Acinetobacter bereziniae]